MVYSNQELIRMIYFLFTPPNRPKSNSNYRVGDTQDIISTTFRVKYDLNTKYIFIYFSILFYTVPLSS